MLQTVTPNEANGFRWRGRLYHLTYKGHIPQSVLYARLEAMSRIKIIARSMVHETSDAEVPYDHTHLAWVWHRAVDLTGCDKMDVTFGGECIHPEIETKKSLAWMERIFTQYHRGHKTAADGKVKFVEPAAGPWQELPAEFEWGDYITTEVSASPDLIDGVCAAGIRPKSVSDVALLLRHKRPPPFDHNFKRDSFIPQAVPVSYVTKEVGTLQIYGAVRLGKTEWACAQFENPHLVTSRDALLDFRPNYHDGIVIDKMVFNDWTVTDCEALTDWTQPARVKCRYGDAKIPKHVPKIVVTNARDVWPADPFGQLVGRRVAQMPVIARMY